MSIVRLAAAVLSLPLLAGLAACPSNDATPVCAPNQTLDGSGNCVPIPGSCPPNMAWNGATCILTQPPICPPGSGWNGTACVGVPAPCPAGQQWNGSACVAATPTPGGACTPAQTADATASMVATQALTALAQSKAPGMKPVGSATAGMFQAGQCLEQQVMLNPGKCYTAVASGVGPTELDVQLVLAAGPLSSPIAQDQTTGPVAVLGESPNCYQWLAPVAAPAKLVLKSSAGQGPAAVQLFER